MMKHPVPQLLLMIKLLHLNIMNHSISIKIGTKLDLDLMIKNIISTRIEDIAEVIVLVTLNYQEKN